MTENRASARQRGYSSKWDKARKAYLAAHPYCAPCKRAGRVTWATRVDHKVPHRGNMALFWDSTNWEGNCSHCHDSDKQRFEKSGKAQYRGSDVNGCPLDPSHPWNLPNRQSAKRLGPPPSGRTGERVETHGREMKSGQIGITSPEALVEAESRALTPTVL